MNAPGKINGLRTMSSREFNQHTSRAKAAADEGPVVITDRGKPSYVLLSYEAYSRVDPRRLSALESIADPRPEADFDFDFPRVRGLVRDVSLDDK
jgi:prevent-host-death family protein